MGAGKRLSEAMQQFRTAQRRRAREKFAQRASNVAQEWSEARSARGEMPQAGTSNFAPAQVPYGVDLAAAWSWRLLVIGLAGYALALIVAMFSLVILPIVIALLLAALVSPLVNVLQRVLPRGIAALVVVLGTLGFIALLLTFAGQQVANGANDLAKQVVAGLEQIRVWLKTGPLQASDSQINAVIKQVQDAVTSGNAHVVTRVTQVGSAIGHILAGFFIVLFATYFFLADGARIWSWVVRIFPRVSRARADSSGHVAWLSLTRFVRATVLVAFTDAVGIMVVAVVLKVPFVLAIGVLVFLGAFIPVIGATLSGSVAVLVALVAHGPIVALIMLGGLIAVQQLEAHVLQPFLLGRLVAIHPLGVILAIAAGVLVAGIAGALVAVPLVAALNAVVLHIADSARPAPEVVEPDDDGDPPGIVEDGPDVVATPEPTGPPAG